MQPRSVVTPAGLLRFASAYTIIVVLYYQNRTFVAGGTTVSSLWDLEQRGVADIDIPALVLGIAA